MGRRRAEQGGGAAAQRPARAAGASTKGRPATTGRHFRGSRRAPLWLKISAASLAGLLVAGIAVAGVMVMRLQGNVQVADLNLGSNSTTAPAADDNHDPLQILIMGTDTRAGSDGEYGSTSDSGGAGNSDVMMLMNISADNKRVSVISFPRDLIVPIPACRNPATGNFSAPQQAGQLNSALSLGGPGCTVAAINQMTGMNIDHFMLADFNAVKQLTTTLGGVEVCVDTAVKDPASGLDLPAGKSNIQGEQALSFLRERHAFGDASDISRIKAQQAFLASMTRKIKDEGTLTDIPKLYSIAETVTKNLTVDKGLSNVNSMMAIAGRLKNVDLSKVAFVTVPWTAYAPDPGRVQLLQPAASQVFAAVRSDADLTGGTTAATGAAATSAPAPDAAASAPGSAPAYNKAIQPITVTNATGVQGRSLELANALAAAGYTDTAQNTAAAAVGTTQILYGPDFADVAGDVANLFGIPASALVPTPGINGVRIQAGQDFLSGVKFGQTELPPDVVSQTAQQPTQCQSVNNLPR